MSGAIPEVVGCPMRSTDRWTDADVRAVLGERGCRVIQGLNPTPALPVQPPVALVRPPYRSKTEARYAQLLDLWQHEGQVKLWAYEPMKLRLGDTCFYTPDFLVIWAMAPWPIQLHEVKGGFWREDARVKIKVAASLYPYFTFRAVSVVKGDWRYEDIPAQRGGTPC